MSTYAPTYIPVTATTPTEGVTVSFSEKSKGWVSFKSFIQDGGLSLNNCYYTFKNTTAVDTNGNFTNSDFLIWKHHDNEVRNNFYGQQYDSHVDVLFNEESATVKSFASMKYEGSQSKITEDLTDPAYFNNQEEKGWYVESGTTDLQEAGHMEFKNKEGKWFSHMKGTQVKTSAQLNSKEFSYQGIDVLGSTAICVSCIYGCIDPIALNYDSNATVDDGSCTYPPYSCWECDSNTGDCIEDTNPLNGPCNDYATEAACLASNCSPGVPPPRYTLTINDSTPDQQQINYSVSTFTKTNILGDTVIHHFGTGIFPDSEYRLEISADAGYTVRASDFAIEFPTGVTPAATSLSGGTPSSTPFFYIDDFTGSQQNLGQGYDLGTGPLVYMVMFKDSENPTHDANWAGPSASNKVMVDCFIGTDMDDNIPGAPNWPTNMEVYMTHNGMSSSNTINPGIPGDLNIFINIIGSAQTISQPIPGCTDVAALNYDPNATVNDGSCTYPPLITYGCTDDGTNPSFLNRPSGYVGAAINYYSGANADDGSCLYNDCNPIINSLAATLQINDATSITSTDGKVEIVFNGTPIIPALSSGVEYNWYEGTLSNHVDPVQLSLSQQLLGSSGVSSGNSVNDLNLSRIDDGPIKLGLAPGNYHVSMDTGDSCFRWYDFTVGPSQTTDVYGCSDPLACNYDPLVTIDDSSCIMPDGCTDATAYNYDPLATCDDGSCYWLCNQPTVTTVVDKDEDFGPFVEGSVTFSWADMNDPQPLNTGNGGGEHRCSVDGIKIRYRRIAPTTGNWITTVHVGGQPNCGGGCFPSNAANYSGGPPANPQTCGETTTTLKSFNWRIGNLYGSSYTPNPSYTWEFEYRLYYCIDPINTWSMQPTITNTKHNGERIRFPDLSGAPSYLEWTDWIPGGTFTS